MVHNHIEINLLGVEFWFEFAAALLWWESELIDACGVPKWAFPELFVVSGDTLWEISELSTTCCDTKWPDSELLCLLGLNRLFRFGRWLVMWPSAVFTRPLGIWGSSRTSWTKSLSMFWFGQMGLMGVSKELGAWDLLVLLWRPAFVGGVSLEWTPDLVFLPDHNLSGTDICPLCL